MPSRYSWDTTHPAVQRLREEVGPVRESVLAHPIYRELVNYNDIVAFMSHHIFAVWDFMSLLKTLQWRLTCIDVPWVPTEHRECRRLINEIVLVEESDEYGGSYLRADEDVVGRHHRAGGIVRRHRGRDADTRPQRA